MKAKIQEVIEMLRRATETDDINDTMRCLQLANIEIRNIQSGIYSNAPKMKRGQG